MTYKDKGSYESSPPCTVQHLDAPLFVCFVLRLTFRWVSSGGFLLIVLQCVDVCGCVLQRVAMGEGVPWCVAVCSVLQCVAVYCCRPRRSPRRGWSTVCSVLYCVAACCCFFSVLQCVGAGLLAILHSSKGEFECVTVCVAACVAACMPFSCSSTLPLPCAALHSRNGEFENNAIYVSRTHLSLSDLHVSDIHITTHLSDRHVTN